MSPQPQVFLVIAFDHPLQAVESVADRIASGLCCQGINAAACSLPRDAAKIAAIPKEQITGILSMGSLPLNQRIEGQWLWERVDCPVTVYLLDAILYDLPRGPVLRHFRAAARRDNRLGLASPETGYQHWLAAELGVRWAPLRFGHFGKTQLGEAPVTPQDRLCVIGTIGQELGGSPATETLSALLERLGLGTARQPLQDALLADDAPAMPTRTTCDVLGWDVAMALQQAPALIAVDSWVKRHRRLAAVRSLQGVPVDFFGSGWRELLGEVDGFRYVGQIGHQDIATVLRHYRGLVNFDPNWADGVHDRVYTACAMGTPVLTNANSVLDGGHLPDELVLRYDAQRPQLGACVEASRLLSSAPAPTQVRHDVMNAHNWATRIGQWLSDCPALHTATQTGE
jgi:hypothetical protein